MARWIASDQDTANKLLQRFGPAAIVVEQPVFEPAKTFHSLLQARNSIVLLSSDSAEHTLVARIRSSCTSAAKLASDSLPGRREPRQIATGFLGLVDELVWEEEETPKRNWWQKLVD